MIKITDEIRNNPVYTNTAIAFQKQEPGNIGNAPFTGETLPDSVTVLENGDVALTIYAPKAETVSAGLMDREHFSLTKNSDGVWKGVLPFPGYGLSTLDWIVDGNRVLNPHAPVYFSYARPINYVDIPDPAMDYILVKNVPHGSVAIEFFKSEVTGNCERCLVYLPPDYEKSGLDYPVLYLQHGGMENEICWTFNGKINFIMDNLLAQDKTVPCIIVMCNGSIRLPGEGPFDFQGFVDMLRIDCIPFIEGKYRVKKEKWGRAMAGLSMGSMQTSLLGMTHPELFGYLGLFSGFLRNGQYFEDSSYLKLMEDAEEFKKMFRVFFRSIGTQDSMFAATFEEDSALMKEVGLSPELWNGHIQRKYPGNHCWHVWRQTIYDFLQLIFREQEKE